MRKRILGEITEVGLRIIELRDRHVALRETLAGIENLLGIKEARPKGLEAVEIVAREAIQAGEEEDEDWALTVPEIVLELARRGWLPASDNPESAVRASIRRLKERDPRWGLYRGRLYYHDRPLPEDDEEEEEA